MNISILDVDTYINTVCWYRYSYIYIDEDIDVDVGMKQEYINY